jgi:hypothetical protein
MELPGPVYDSRYWPLPVTQRKEVIVDIKTIGLDIGNIAVRVYPPIGSDPISLSQAPPA